MKTTVGEFLVQRLIRWGDTEAAGGLGVCLFTSPDEPAMPGEVRYEQATKSTEAFLRGQPHELSTLATVARDKFNPFRA